MVQLYLTCTDGAGSTCGQLSDQPPGVELVTWRGRSRWHDGRRRRRRRAGLNGGPGGSQCGWKEEDGLQNQAQQVDGTLTIADLTTNWLESVEHPNLPNIPTSQLAVELALDTYEYFINYH